MPRHQAPATSVEPFGNSIFKNVLSSNSVIFAGETAAFPGRPYESYAGEYLTLIVRTILGKAALKFEPWERRRLAGEDAICRKILDFLAKPKRILKNQF